MKKTVIENNNDFELFFEEHSEEIRQRIFQSFLLTCIIIIISFINIDLIIKLLQKPVSSLKFFQLSPGEYFISTIEISLFFGLLISSPMIVNQLIFFLLPGLNEKEKLIIPFIIISSIILFFISLIFSYFVLIPITLGFFIDYGKNSIEPLLSYSQYISFISVIFLSNGILFQIPIIQILISLLDIISGKKMLQNWKNIIIIATIISAIFTPSADPLTQILLPSVLITLYFGGAFISILFESI